MWHLGLPPEVALLLPNKPNLTDKKAEEQYWQLAQNYIAMY